MEAPHEAWAGQVPAAGMENPLEPAKETITDTKRGKRLVKNKDAVLGPQAVGDQVEAAQEGRQKLPRPGRPAPAPRSAGSARLPPPSMGADDDSRRGWPGLQRGEP